VVVYYVIAHPTALQGNHPFMPSVAPAMNVVGPSQPCFGWPGANGRASNASEYEEDLLQLLLDLGLLGTVGV